MQEKIGQVLVRKKIITEFDLKAAIERQNKEPNKYLGQILCEMGLPQSKIVRAIYSSNRRKQVGQILVDLQIITAEQLSETLLEQQSLKRKGIFIPLGTLLIRTRVIDEKSYVNALSAHFSMPVVSLKNHNVSTDLQQIIGEVYAAKNHVVVLRSTPQLLTAAVAEPDLIMFEHLEKLMPKGKSILFCLAKASDIRECLEKKYDPYHNQRIRY